MGDSLDTIHRQKKQRKTKDHPDGRTKYKHTGQWLKYIAIICVICTVCCFSAHYELIHVETTKSIVGQNESRQNRIATMQNVGLC